LSAGAVMTLGFALLSDTYPANELGVEMGKAIIGQTFGMMVGPPVGGLLQEHMGKRAPYIFCLILIVIDLIARLFIIEPRSDRVKAIRKYEKEKTNKMDVESANGSNGAVGGDGTNKSEYFATLLGLISNPRLITALFVGFTEAFLIACKSVTSFMVI
jgi:MFS family permease